jgi:dihydrofolate reductase
LALPGLDRFQEEVLTAFFQRQGGFFLTGGAALAGFYLNHRTTKDLDLFTTEDRLDEGEQVLADVARGAGAKLERIQSSSTFRRFLLTRGTESLIVDLVRDTAPRSTM